MSLARTSRFILGDQTTRKTLESTYVSGNVSEGIVVQNAEQLLLEVEYTMGTAETSNSIQLKVEFADPLNIPSNGGTPADTDWYGEVTESASSGTVTINLAEYSFDAVSSAGTYDRFVIALPNSSQFVRVSMKETGVASNKGSASVKLVSIEEEVIS